MAGAASASSEGDIADPDDRRAARRRSRRGRQLRRRVARRPVDPRSRGVPADRRHRRPRAARSRAGPRRAPAALPPGLDRRGVRLGRGRPLAGGRPARAALAVRRREGRRRAARPQLRRDPRRRRRRDPRLEHLRAVPPPGEAHPAVRHQRHRRPAAAALRRRAPATRLAVRRRSRRGRSTTCCVTARPARPTTSRAASEMANRDVVASAARAPRQAVVAGPPRRGPARARPALRDGRHASSRRSAGGRGRRSRTGWRRPSTGSSPTRRGGGPHARATGTPTTSGSTGRACASRRLMRVAVTGAAGRLGQRPGHGPGAMRRSPARPARSRGPGRASTSTRPPASDACSTATGPRSSSTPPPGPTSTAAPATRSWRCGGTGTPTGVLAGGCAARGIDLVVVSTNEVFDGRRTDGRGYRPDDQPRPRNPYGASKLAGERGRAGRPTRAASGAARRSCGRRGCTGRRATTSRARSWPPPSGPRRPASRSASSATSGARRPTARDVADAIVELLGRATRIGRASTTSSTAASRRAPTGRASSSAGSASRSRSRRSRPRPGTRASTPPRWGVLEPDAAAARRADPAVAGRDGRLRSRPRSRRRRGRPRDEPRSARRRRRSPASATAPVARHADERGAFRELWRSDAFGPIDAGARRARPPGAEPRFVQANLSTSAAGRAARPAPPPPPARPLGRRDGSGLRRARRRPADARRRRPAGRRDARARQPTMGR